MIDVPALQSVFQQFELDAWSELLPEQMQKAFAEAKHGDFDRWQYIVENMPAVKTQDFDLTADLLRIGIAAELQPAVQKSLHQSLRTLQPWRKGPFSIFGLHIDTEWRSDWKWQRLQPHLSPLQGRRVLDVGCGSGYHCWRMAGEGAALVVGIDPNMLFLSQFTMIKNLLQNPPEVHFLPLGVEALPAAMKVFDTVFSMGILYHRRSPMEHLQQLRDLLRPGGELVLETLVIQGDEQQVLVPQGRYAKMRNVWFIPSAQALLVWLRKCGFSDVRVVDSAVTTVTEQRTTDWMAFESLIDFLDPDDAQKTVEGYPAPERAVFIARV